MGRQQCLRNPSRLPNYEFLSDRPQHSRERLPRIHSVPHERWTNSMANRGFNPPYDISYRGLKPPRVSAALGRCYLRSGADLPQVRAHLPTR
jgi:hypothetical protein